MQDKDYLVLFINAYLFTMKNLLLSFFLFFISVALFSQNPIIIPGTIEDSNINLTLQNGTFQFFSGEDTATMGANGPLLDPTLILNQGDNYNVNITNDLGQDTTIHWHGLHVSAANDGGPHTVINPGATWNPQFTVLDKAGLHWYHPHLHMQTDKHVSKGIAGLIIVRDTEEATLGLPMNYGVDEFPMVLQTKGFDASGQILVHTDLDTSVMVNGTVNAQVDFPAQVVRLRVLNGSSQRVMEFGFSDNRSFSLIGTDGGLLTAPVNLTRYRISSGQRADILVDLSSDLGQNIQIMSFASELPNAIYGATQPGMGAGATASLPDYPNNPLNGTDFQLLDINVVAQTAAPVLSIPSTLASWTAIPESAADITRTLTFTSAGAMGNLNGPFLINGATFDMETINYTIPLGNTEIWTLTNQTPIAHPFHIHDVQFFILDINGTPPPAELQGFNDVVLVPGGNGVVRFIAQFSDHANDSIPYMYHCHMLPHEDMGMMGQFLVIDPAAAVTVNNHFDLEVYPNPTSSGLVTLRSNEYKGIVQVFSTTGQQIETFTINPNQTKELRLQSGIYILQDESGNCERVIVL